LIQWHFAKRNIFTGKVAWNSYLTHGLRHNCVIDQSATEKVIHTLIIDFFSQGLRNVKIEQELENRKLINVKLFTIFMYFTKDKDKHRHTTQHNIIIICSKRFTPQVLFFPLFFLLLVHLVFLCDNFLAHLTLWVRWAIVTTERPSSVVRPSVH
jgi:hypothetical protein